MAYCRKRLRRMLRRSPPCSRDRAPSHNMTRVAVVLMNLGGPDSLASVQPFLLNLFSDPAIIGLPGFLRAPLARFVAWRRAPVARDIYARLGGRSPLLGNTEAQARALEAALGPGYRCFVAMRYWHPLSAATAREVAEWAPDEIVCLPLYPQFSTTTRCCAGAPKATLSTAVALNDWPGSNHERDPRLAVHLADQPQDQGDLRRLVAFAGAHDDRRNRLLRVERAVHDTVAAQPLHGDRHPADADLRGHQTERRLNFPDLV